MFVDRNNKDTFSQKITPVPQQRIMDRLDLLMTRKDYVEAENHLLYWLGEAERGHDLPGQLMVCNELIGFYRKTGKKTKAFDAAGKALALLQTSEFDGLTGTGTTYVNIATAYSAFKEYEKSLEYFDKARIIYEADPQTPMHLLGGLYNNMALSFQALGRFSDAFACYENALTAMEQVRNGVLEQAITYLNMADALSAEKGIEQTETQVFYYLDKAYDLLMDESSPRDGYYAFVCEKCAPGFSYYGYFAAAEELREEARKIYERA